MDLTKYLRVPIILTGDADLAWLRTRFSDMPHGLMIVNLHYAVDRYHNEAIQMHALFCVKKIQYVQSMVAYFLHTLRTDWLHDTQVEIRVDLNHLPDKTACSVGRLDHT